jgi:hypothetical protein
MMRCGGWLSLMRRGAGLARGIARRCGGCGMGGWRLIKARHCNCLMTQLRDLMRQVDQVRRQGA